MKHFSDATIKTTKLFFNLSFIGVIVFHLIKRALNSLPHDGLFFMTSDAVENFLCCAIAFTAFYYLFRSGYFWLKAGLILVMLSLLIALAALKDYRIHTAITFDATFGYFTAFLGKTLLFYAVLFIVNKLETLNKYRKLEEELNLTKAQLLRNQLHPHFLFNAFNSLYSLSIKTHPELAEYVLKLSSMMRYVTDETHLTEVPLTKELDFIQKYIAIEKMRFGIAADIQLLEANAIPADTMIAPFVLVPLVENAFKHGFYTNATSAFVHIKVTLDEKELVFVVTNRKFEKQHFQETGRIGKGLENLQQRLKLLYAKTAHLQIDNTTDIYTATLSIPIYENV